MAPNSFHSRGNGLENFFNWQYFLVKKATFLKAHIEKNVITLILITMTDAFKTRFENSRAQCALVVVVVVSKVAVEHAALSNIFSGYINQLLEFQSPFSGLFVSSAGYDILIIKWYLALISGNICYCRCHSCLYDTQVKKIWHTLYQLSGWKECSIV